MKTTWIIYILAWLIPIALVVLYLVGAIKPMPLQTDEVLVYMLSITTVALSLLTAWLAIKMFALKPIKTKLDTLKGKEKESSIQMLNRVRTLAILMVVVLDFAAYYITDSTSPLYLAAILGVALIFCWPQTPNS
ncbi:MAG: hypothetical protein IJT90_05000 [Bacteroidaceae bacterium]|nr:hypothetical protein [Bacteroidaceae bacterium]